MADFIECKDAAAAAALAEQLGAAYAQARGLPWPMPPDAYTAGRQPEPREAYYQRFGSVVPLEHLVPIPADVLVLPVDVSARKDESQLTAAGKAVVAKSRTVPAALTAAEAVVGAVDATDPKAVP